MSQHSEEADVPANVLALSKKLTPEDAIRYYSERLSQLGLFKRKQDFILLFEHFAPKIKAYIMRLGLTDSVAEELMQETMINVWRRAESYKREKAAASTWIFTLARNVSIDWMRKQSYPVHNQGDDAEWDRICESQEGASADIISAKMTQALEKLPEEQSQVIYMSYFEGRAHSEIAQRLGIPLGSVKSRLRLAFGKLKAAWGEA